MSSEPIRQPANDLIAFDISKQSPQQIAHLFARWKEQRERLQGPEPRRGPPHLKPVPPVMHGAAEETEEAAPIADTELGGAVRYSASFEALLSARGPTLAQRVWNPDAGLAKLGRPHAPRRRFRTKWLLAGAASVVALTAMAGGVLWERSAGRLGWTQVTDKPAAGNALIAGPAEAAVAPAHPMDIPMAEPLVAKATAARQADWPMRQTVDLALMKTAPVAETAQLPLMPQVKPPVPVVWTASKPAAKPAAAQPKEAPVTRVELPLVPSVTTATVSVPVAPATDAHNGDSRSDIVTGRGNDKNNFTFGTNGRVASSSSRPAGASGSGGAHGSGSAGGSTGGSGDPGSGGTGGDPGGSTGGSGPGGGDTGGGDTGGGAGGGDTGGGDAGGGDAGGADPGGGGDAGGGDAGGGDAGGGDSGGDSGGGDAGGGGDSGGGDSGGGDSGGGDSGGAGDSGGSDAGGGDTGGGDASGGESGESGGSGGGIGGAIGGAIGGIGDAIGGALGGGKGGPKGDKDKDKDKGKDKDKAD